MVKQTRHIGATLVAAVAALALISAPANAKARNEFGGESTARSIEQDPITLYVMNDNKTTVDVYAVVEGGKLSKIGRVNGQNSRSFEIPASLVDNGGQLQLKVFRVESPAGGMAASATVGSRGIRTHPFAVASGSVVELWIDGNFGSSRAFLHAG